jgi:four helix bundle protein
MRGTAENDYDDDYDFWLADLAMGDCAGRCFLRSPRTKEPSVFVLDHEKLEVYQRARELSREICQVRKKIKAGRADVVDQLLRATSSIPLNTAEGNGEASLARRAYFFRIARGSTTEVAATLDHMVDMELLDEADIAAAKQLAARIAAMLTKLIGSVTTADSYPPLPKPRRSHNS